MNETLITPELLAPHVCGTYLTIIEREWPKGGKVTLKNLRRCLELGMTIDTIGELIGLLLPGKYEKIFEREDDKLLKRFDKEKRDIEKRMAKKYDEDEDHKNETRLMREEDRLMDKAETDDTKRYIRLVYDVWHSSTSKEVRREGT